MRSGWEYIGALSWDLTRGAGKGTGGIPGVPGVEASWGRAWLSRPGVISARASSVGSKCVPRPPGKEWCPWPSLWAASLARGQASRERRAESAGLEGMEFPWARQASRLEECSTASWMAPPPAGPWAQLQRPGIWSCQDGCERVGECVYCV